MRRQSGLRTSMTCSAGDDEIRVAYLAAKYSLHHMEVKDEWKNREGLYAGIPWFAQFWLRDFAISSDQLVISAAHAIYARYLDHWIMRGTIHGHEAPGTLAYADTEGLFSGVRSALCVRERFKEKSCEKQRNCLFYFLPMICRRVCVTDLSVTTRKKHGWIPNIRVRAARCENRDPGAYACDVPLCGAAYG